MHRLYLTGMAQSRHEESPETTTTVTASDWSGEDISGQKHVGVLFVDPDLTESENTGASFEDCTFRGARFNVSIHRDAAFVNCTFSGCSFYNAQFTDCKFVGSVFARCSFDGTVITGGNWSFVGLRGADLRTALLRGVRLREADLSTARCQGSSLRDTDLSAASLHGADLTGCDLRGSDLSGIEPEHVQLRGAIITVEQTIAIAEALGLDVRVD